MRVSNGSGAPAVFPALWIFAGLIGVVIGPAGDAEGRTPNPLAALIAIEGPAPISATPAMAESVCVRHSKVRRGRDKGLTVRLCEAREHGADTLWRFDFVSKRGTLVRALRQWVFPSPDLALEHAAKLEETLNRRMGSVSGRQGRGCLPKNVADIAARCETKGQYQGGYGFTWGADGVSKLPAPFVRDRLLTVVLNVFRDGAGPNWAVLVTWSPAWLGEYAKRNAASGVQPDVLTRALRLEAPFPERAVPGDAARWCAHRKGSLIESDSGVLRCELTHGQVTFGLAQANKTQLGLFIVHEHRAKPDAVHQFAQSMSSNAALPAPTRLRVVPESCAPTRPGRFSSQSCLTPAKVTLTSFEAVWDGPGLPALKQRRITFLSIRGERVQTEWQSTVRINLE